MEEVLPREPFVAVERPGYLVVFKPSGMHGAPLSAMEEGTLLSWCAVRWPEVLAVSGKKSVEGGLLHRLDRDTAGLVVLARDQLTYDFLLGEQEKGFFVKEYEAHCIDLRDDDSHAALAADAGFPPRPFRLGNAPCELESAFRPYGPGRRAVRPLASADAAGIPARLRAEAAFDRGRPYRTSIRGLSPSGEGRMLVRASLERGFRHQIRCHLAWFGLPIEGDALYGLQEVGEAGKPLALTATAVSFRDPEGNGPQRWSLSDFISSGSGQ